MKTAIVIVGALLFAPAKPPVSPPAPAVRALRIGPISDRDAGIEFVFDGPGTPCGQRLGGYFSLFGSGGIAVDGTVTMRPEGGCSIRFVLPFASTTSETLSHVSVTAIDWTFRGELSGKGVRRSVAWSAKVPREKVGLTESMKITLRRFVAVKETHIGSVGFGKSALNVDLDLKNPLGFDLRFVVAAYDLTIDGKPVAKGRREKFIVHAGVTNRLEMPVELSHGGVLGSIWKAATGGKVEGVLAGVARLRVPVGDVEFPFELPVKLRK
jgi:Late embryogenesis abundant protein